MATLAHALADRPWLGPADREWLHQLVGDWQLIADFSFADLLLWVGDGKDGWEAVAHVRPTTGPLVFFQDQYGRRADHPRVVHALSHASRAGTIVRLDSVDNPDDIPVREDYVPVTRAGVVIAVLSRHTHLQANRPQSQLERTYLASADALARMVAAGEFPHATAPTGLRRGDPRVGDGGLRLDFEGIVEWASPNATSAIHRLGHLGDVVGNSLAELVTGSLRDESPVDEGLPLVLTGRQPWRSEVSSRGTVVSMRAIPLTKNGQREGAILLVRDIGELRRRERELLTKDATIREIHHRVKNNLQSVAALLRLQARRVPAGEARSALEEAERRVGTIALVHDTLSQGFDETVDFDEVAERGFRAIVDVAAQGPVERVTSGSFGRLRAEDASALAMIMSELVQNAIEHGLGDKGGTIAVTIERDQPSDGVMTEQDAVHEALSEAEGSDGQVSDVGDGPILRVTIDDDGAGIGPGRGPGSGLGTQIVRSLVQDLRGTIHWLPREGGGTRVTFTAMLRPIRP